MNIEEEKIAIIDESIISIYNDSYLLYNEIDLKKIKNSKVEIKSLYQMKNKNLICATKEGDIFIFEIKKKIIKQLKSFQLKKKYIKQENLMKIIYVYYRKIILKLEITLL